MSTSNIHMDTVTSEVYPGHVVQVCFRESGKWKPGKISILVLGLLTPEYGANHSFVILLYQPGLVQL